MAEDFRIEIGFTNHPKTRKLIRACGMEGFYCLIALWEYATINFPEGSLKGMDGVSIEDAVRWCGPPGTLYQTLIELKFLDDKKPLELHDWKEHQPWVVGAKERKTRASNAAHAMHQKKHALLACSEHANSMLPAHAPSLPSLPSLPSINNRKTSVTGECVEDMKKEYPMMNVDQELKNFNNYNPNRKRPLKDYNAGFRTWMYNAATKFGTQPIPPSSKKW